MNSVRKELCQEWIERCILRNDAIMDIKRNLRHLSHINRVAATFYPGLAVRSSDEVNAVRVAAGEVFLEAAKVRTHSKSRSHTG